MSLLIADITPEFGIISGENHWITKDGRVLELEYKVRQYGRYAVGCCGHFGLCEEIHRSLRMISPPDLDYENFLEAVEITATFLRKANEKAGPVSVVVLGYSEAEECVRAALIELADASNVRIREGGPILATGVDVSEARQWLRAFHRANPQADLSRVVTAHADLYAEASARNREIGANPDILAVTKDGVLSVLNPGSKKTAETAEVESTGNLLLKNKVNGAGVTSFPSTTSTTFVVIPEMTTTITTHGNKVLVTFSGTFLGSGTLTSGVFTGFVAIFRDGVQVSAFTSSGRVPSNFLASFVLALTYIDSPSAGSHTYDVRWQTSFGGSGSPVLESVAANRQLEVVELG